MPFRVLRRRAVEGIMPTEKLHALGEPFERRPQQGYSRWILRDLLAPFDGPHRAVLLGTVARRGTKVDVLSAATELAFRRSYDAPPSTR